MNREAHTAGAVAYPHGDHLRAAVRRGAATFDGSVVELRSRGAVIAFPGKAFRRSGTPSERYQCGVEVGRALVGSVAESLARIVAPWVGPTQADYTRVEAP